MKILYVDDEEANLFIFKAHFRRKYHILTAPSGIAALDILEKYYNEIAIVISDMRMPVLNGLEFVTRAKEKYSDITYFILTGFDQNDKIDTAVENNLIAQ